MIIRGATEQQIIEALDKANHQFNGNLMFRRLDPCGKGFRVTLKVRDSHGAGARLGYYQNPITGKRKHLVSACWHAHGTFFDALPRGTIIRTAQHVTRPGWPWNDWNIGSIMEPLFCSQACKCDSQYDEI